MPHARPPKLRAPAGQTRRRRAPAAAGVALLALGLATSAAIPEARADMMSPGEKRIKATWELTGIDEHPDYLFVAFPYGGCPIEQLEDDESRKRHDEPWTNYEVLRPGHAYQPVRYCDTKIYAFKASDFVTEERALTEQLDYYRFAGHQLTIIKGFEELKTTEKYKFVERSRSVFPSSIKVSFPDLIDKTIPYESTHDVLRVTSVTASATQIEGVRVVVTTEAAGGKVTKEIPYQGGQRPKEVGAMFEPEPDENDVSDSVAKALCAALVSVGFIGLGLALRRRPEPKKRDGLSGG